MLADQAKRLLRQSACTVHADLKKDLNQYLSGLTFDESFEILTQCAMLASRHGILSHLKVLVELNSDILTEKQSGVFRMSAEIENVENFKCVTDYLLQADKKHLIDVNALDSGFLKECIKREKLEYIQYLIENKQVAFDLKNSNMIKTLLRYENAEILNYFIVDLKIPIEQEDLTHWMVDNNHLDSLSKINKCNMFIKLAQKLENKNTTVKVKKI